MYGSDLLMWGLRIADSFLTGQHNSNVDYARNPKKKRQIPKPFSGRGTDTFAGHVMPARWQKAYGDHEEVMTREAAESSTQRLIENIRLGK